MLIGDRLVVWVDCKFGVLSLVLVMVKKDFNVGVGWIYD